MADAVSSQEPLVPAPNIPPSQGSDTSPVPASRRNLIIFVILLAILLLTMGGILVYVLTSDRWQSGGENGTNEPEENEDDTDEDDLLTCTYNGVTYEDGEGFPSTDGCNSCSCTDGEVVCTLMACEEEDGTDDVNGDEVEGEVGDQYGTTTLSCVIDSRTVTIRNEYPVSVTVSQQKNENDGRCVNVFSYGNSTLTIGYVLGIYLPTSYSIENSTEISSQYLDSLIRVKANPGTGYIYGIPQGTNDCYQKPEDDPCNVYFGNDEQYLFNQGLADYGIANVSIGASDNTSDVLSIFDYIAGHSTVVAY